MAAKAAAVPGALATGLVYREVRPHMNCTQAEQLLPLHAGNDLPTEQAAAVGAHLESCASCQALATEFAASRAWLSAFGTPTFDEAALDELRAAVRREITRTEPPSALSAVLAAWWRPRFAVAMAVLLLLAGLSFYAYRRQPTPVKEAPVARNETKQKQPEPPPESPPNASGGNGAAVTARQLLRRRSARRSGLAMTPRVLELPAHDVAAATNQVDAALQQAAGQLAARTTTRIELQTADPNIRIIWFAPKADWAATSKRN